MKLAKTAFIYTLTMLLALTITTSAQTLRTADDNRNIAPTVGTGGPVGGPTGLFTIYDGQTLRKGEFTFSAAYSNYDRDPGNVDLTEIPLSFQVGLSDNVELFFNTDAYRAVKVNSPRNLSSFYLPNSQLNINGRLTSGGAIVLSPNGGAGNQFPNRAVFRPQGTQPFIGFPFFGGDAGTFGFNRPFNAGTVFGFTRGFALIGQPVAGNDGADNFPGLGSIYGSILPGIVLQTVPLRNAAGVAVGTAPSVFTTQPTYLPDAPFINRTYGESAFNTFTVGGKFRFTGPNNPVGVGIIPFYRFYADDADSASGFNQLQRGASPGGGGFGLGGQGRGDFGLVGFADARLRDYLNVSANIGYIYNSSIKAELANGGDVTLLDRPDELLAGIGVDFPVNRFFQPMLEFRSTQYVGGRTPNAFENSPLDGLAGVRVFPTRYFSLGAAYRYHFNQQDRDIFDDQDTTNNVLVSGRNTAINNTFSGLPPGFQESNDPHGYIFQATIGRRNGRQSAIENQFANVTALALGNNRITLGCPEGQQAAEGITCGDSRMTTVTTTAFDPEGDVLTYNYTVSGGRIVGSGANVEWDLDGVSPGTYTITAGVNDGCGVCGETKTETITVEECANCEVIPVDCVCPSVTISEPSGTTNSGQNMIFTANAIGATGTPSYEWEVDNGEIISGQGTPTITVSTEGLTDTTVRAKVTVTTDDNCNCDVEAFGTGVVTGTPQSYVIDEFTRLVDNDVKARVDNLYITLNNNPNATGYIINYGTPAQIRSRERQIDKALAFRNYDRSRVVIVNGGNRGNGVETVFWIVPAGADAPTPDGDDSDN